MASVENALLVRMEASLAKFEKQMHAGTDVARRTSSGIEGNFDRMGQRVGKSAAQSAAVIERSLNRAEAGYKSVVASIDPVAAAAQRLASQEAQLAEAVKRGIIPIEEQNRVLALARNEYQAVAAAAATTSVQQRRFINLSGAGRFVLQNTAAQMGDIAVQMQMGTDAFRVAGQQLPQILGGFGAMRGALGVIAPLLGTVAAIGIPLAAMFLHNGENAQKASKEVDEFAKKVAAAQSALDAAQQSIVTVSQDGLAKLKERYGEVTQKVLDLVAALHKIDVDAAVKEASNVIDAATGTDYKAAIDKVLNGVAGVISQATNDDLAIWAEESRQAIAGLEQEIALAQSRGGIVPAEQLTLLTQMREELAAMTRDYGAMGSLAADASDESLRYADAIAQASLRLKEARDAGDFSAIADAISDILATLEASGVEIETGIVASLRDAEDKARQTAKMLQDGQKAAEDLANVHIAGSLNLGVDAARALVNELGTAVNNALALRDALNSVAAASMSRQDQIAVLNAQINAARRGASPEGAGAAAETAVDLARSGASVDQIAAQAEAARVETEKLVALRKELSDLTSTSRRGGGGASTIDEMAKKYEALRAQLDPAWKALQAYEDAQTALNWALQNGKVSQEEFNKLLGEADQAYKKAMDSVRDYGTEVANYLGDTIGNALGDMYMAIRNGESAWDALRKAALNALDDIAKEALKMAANAAIKMIIGAMFGGGDLSGTGLGTVNTTGVPYAKGGAFSGGREVAFANGGVVTGPTNFPMRGGTTGLMGEAGPEAIMPLTRASNGRLGVAVTGGSAPASVVQINITGDIPAGTVRQNNGRVDIDLSRMVSQVIASGGADAALRNRFGAAPVGQGR